MGPATIEYALWGSNYYWQNTIVRHKGGSEQGIKGGISKVIRRFGGKFDI